MPAGGGWLQGGRQVARLVLVEERGVAAAHVVLAQRTPQLDGQMHSRHVPGSRGSGGGGGGGGGGLGVGGGALGARR